MNDDEDQLKAALVRALPEKLESHTNDEALPYYSWREQFDGQTNVFVTPHEWPAIVGMVEDRLTDEQKTDYIRAVNKGDFSYRRLTFAKWQTRAAALADIGAITIETP